MLKFLRVWFAALCLFLLSVQCQAASLIDFEDVALTTAATDITDTGAAAAGFVLPIIVGVLAIIIGIKLFKRFGNKI